MEKITAKIDKVELTKALILWNTEVDGERGATCKILDCIPWDTDWDKYMPWDTEVNTLIDNAIGGRDTSLLPDHFIEDTLTRFVTHSTCDLCTIINTLMNLTEWADGRANKIIETYDKVIAELNKRIEETEGVYGMIEKLVGVDCRGFAKYEKVVLIKGKNKSEVINRLWTIAYGLVFPNDWDEGSFKSALHYGNSVSTGENYHFHLGDKVTNS